MISISVSKAYILILSIGLITSCSNYELMNLKSMAKSGDHEAQGNLGFMYQYGYGVRADYNESLKWYKLAASDGDPVAEGTVGRLYFERDDYKNALIWFKKCAAKNISLEKNDEKDNKWEATIVCQAMVGTMYLYGQSTPVNKTEALFWLKKAADQGQGSAQCYVGDLYYQEQNYKLSYPYLKLALEKSCADAARILSIMYRDGLFVEKDDEQAKYLSDKYNLLKE